METSSAPVTSSRIWDLMALVVSLVALIGSLYLSMGMNLKACPLCLYERTFMMGVFGVFLIGSVRSRDVAPGLLAALSLPLAIGGLGVAGFHVYLELTEVLECPAGVFEVGSAPQQSLAAFIIVSVLAGIGLARSCKGTWLATCIGTVILGALFAGAAIKSAPPLPKAPTEPYTKPMEGCRPMFHADKQADKN